MPSAQIRNVVRIVDRHHRHRVLHTYKPLDRLAPDALRWAVGIEQVRMRRLQLDQLAQLPVVLRIGHDRIVVDEVRAIRPIKPLAKFADSLLLRSLGHISRCDRDLLTWNHIQCVIRLAVKQCIAVGALHVAQSEFVNVSGAQSVYSQPNRYAVGRHLGRTDRK